MKKFILGLTIGIIVSISSVAYAADSVSVNPKDHGYEVLNNFNIIADAQFTAKAGHLNVVKEGDHTKIEIQIYTAKTDMGDEHTGEIVFWDDQGKVMEKIPYSFDLPNGTNIIKQQLVSGTNQDEFADIEAKITPIAKPSEIQ
ncbi:hypothetical protein EHS13_31385 [Paenibacillus psychroresistens]|uniref:DUF3221 domain-containing protein n=1 Tax=Paenibacillus psychroresistens TaxID=1778678 RepID=A0A6B8RTG7_9BACL|nr:hypothetical protein [Paenibacillus psychroresistens]QGQ99062.1 hypothetical protein EHS13_31385 [Paenibacillus psychroresistens]